VYRSVHYDPGVDLTLNETERDLVALCRDFAQREIALRAPAAWEAAVCPTDLLREMGELGLLGMLIPEEWGGIGMSTVGFVAAMEQIGLADQSVAAAWQAHVTIGSLPRYLFGTDAQRECWLRPFAEGKVLGAFGLTEPDAGSDTRGITTRAVRADGSWLINGAKTFRPPRRRPPRRRARSRSQGPTSSPYGLPPSATVTRRTHTARSRISHGPGWS